MDNDDHRVISILICTHVLMNLQLPESSICHYLLDKRIKAFSSRLHKLWIQVISKQFFAWKLKLHTGNLKYIRTLPDSFVL
jgi:hypothetical protein